MKGSNFIQTKYVYVMKVKCFKCIPFKKKSSLKIFPLKIYWFYKNIEILNDFSVFWENVYFLVSLNESFSVGHHSKHMHAITVILVGMAQINFNAKHN